MTTATVAAVRERPILMSAPMVKALIAGTKTQTRRVVNPQSEAFVTDDMRMAFGESEEISGWFRRYCRYGVPGDRLWVRETWRVSKLRRDTIVYRADSPPHEDERYRWKSSIHMPRGASRLLLEIVSVRVERLQEISAEDCIVEGLANTLREHDAGIALRAQFAAGWDSINRKRAPWESNPWVWVVGFRRLD